jgi:hypothetical protein
MMCKCSHCKKVHQFKLETHVGKLVLVGVDCGTIIHAKEQA